MPGAQGPGGGMGGHAGRKAVISKGCYCQVWFDATWSDLGLAVKGTLGDCVEDEA